MAMTPHGQQYHLHVKAVADSGVAMSQYRWHTSTLMYDCMPGGAADVEMEKPGGNMK